MKKKLILTTGLLIVVILLVTGFFVYQNHYNVKQNQQNQNVENISWKTYADTDGGFSLMYPSNLNIYKSYSSANEVHLVTFAKNPIDGAVFEVGYSPYFDASSQQPTTYQHILDMQQGSLKNVKNLQEKQISVAGIHSVEFSFTDGDTMIENILVPVSSDTYFTIQAWIDKNYELDEFNKMLDSFKITK